MSKRKELAHWAHVFANPELTKWPGLRCKAFTVWLPTAFDYIRRFPAIDDLTKEASARPVDLLAVPALSIKLRNLFADVLSLFNRDEQLFIRDRRLQNVHGVLDQYSNSSLTIEWFDRSTRSVARVTMTPDEYSAAIRAFYTNMQTSELALLDRLLLSPVFAALRDFYSTRLKFDPHLMDLARKLLMAYRNSKRTGMIISYPALSPTGC